MQNSRVTDAESLIAAMRQARRGLKRDVAQLLAALKAGKLYAPLARPLPGEEPGQVYIAGGMTIALHLLPGSGGLRFRALFTSVAGLEAMGAQADWKTSGGPLLHLGMPGLKALGLASAPPGEGESPVAGVVLDPYTPDSLVLSLEEAAELSHGTAIPLENYAGSLPTQEGEEILFMDEGPPPAPLLAELNAFAKETPALKGFVLHRALLPERQRTPRLLVILNVEEGADRQAVAGALGPRLQPHLNAGEFLNLIFDALPS